jgi:hypothetical protein
MAVAMLRSVTCSSQVPLARSRDAACPDRQDAFAARFVYRREFPSFMVELAN